MRLDRWALVHMVGIELGCQDFVVIAVGCLYLPALELVAGEVCVGKSSLMNSIMFLYVLDSLQWLRAL